MLTVGRLRKFWHPVAASRDVNSAEPYAARLLDEPLVLFRTEDRLIALQDQCIHRGTQLSLGWLSDGNAVCPYHGWEYDADGVCVRIPSLSDDQQIPTKARVRNYRAEEQHGLIWVALDEPEAPIPSFPQEGWAAMGASGTHTYLRQFEWEVSAARLTENSMDYAHFPFVHPTSLGNRGQPLFSDVEVELVPDGLRYVVDNHANESYRHYHLTLPFTLEISVVDQNDPTRQWAQLFACCPQSATQTRHWFINVRNCDLEETDEQFTVFVDEVLLQDKTIVESQRPRELPTDIRDEIHLKDVDKAALEYRRLLRTIGVDS